MKRKTSSKRSSKGEAKKILFSTSYVWYGRSGVRNLARARFSVPIRADPEVHSAFSKMGTWSLSRA
jgi:lipoprotein NlpI